MSKTQDEINQDWNAVTVRKHQKNTGLKSTPDPIVHVQTQDGFIHQDLNIVTLKKHQKSTGSTGPIVHKKKAVGGKNIQNDVPNLAKFDVDNIVLPELSSESLAKQIQTCRLEMGIKQDELNTRCSFPHGTIAKYEKGEAQYKQHEVTKMAKIFGKSLKK